MLVVDASVAFEACARSDGFEILRPSAPLVAPALMWSETRSALRLRFSQGVIAAEDADGSRARLESCPVDRQDHGELGRRAWEIAERLGWSRTYDAEYLALADLLGCRVVTLDGRLRRGADRLDLVVSPAEL